MSLYVLKRKSEVAIYVFLFLVFFWPTYLFGFDFSAAQKAHYFISVILCLVTAFYVRPRAELHLGMLILLPLLFVYFFSFFQRIPSATFFEIGLLIKLFLFFVYTAVVYMLLKSVYPKVRDVNKLSSAFFFIFYLQLSFIFLQIVFGDSSLLQVWNHKDVETHWGIRPPGTFDWVYSTCFFLTFFVIYLTYQILLSIRVKWSLFILLSTLLCILLSQSKVGYLSTILCLLYFYFLLCYFSLEGKFRLLLLFLLAIFFIVVIVIFSGIDISYVGNFFKLFMEGKLDGSTGTRKTQALIAVNDGLQYWYSGSPEALKGKIIENGYLDYLFRYGVFGLLGYSMFLLSVYCYSFHVLSRTVLAFKKSLVGKELVIFMMSAHITLFSLLLYSNSGTITDGYKASFWFYLLLASCFWVHHRCSAKGLINGVG